MSKKLEIWLADWVFKVKVRENKYDEYVVKDQVTLKVPIDQIKDINNGYDYNRIVNKLPRDVRNNAVDKKGAKIKKDKPMVVHDIRWIRKIGDSQIKKSPSEDRLSPNCSNMENNDHC